MNILFVISETQYKHFFETKQPLHTQEDIHLGLSYIAALLDLNGHTTDVFIVTKRGKYTLLDKKIKEFAPSVMCFSSVHREFDCIAETSQYVRQHYDYIYQVAGGVNVTLNPDVINRCDFDAVCVGEGEYPILELITTLAEKQRPAGIDNIWFKNGQEIEINETRSFLCDLDKLPFPKRSMWQPYIRNKSGIHVVLIGRGCPYNCTYCCNHALRNVSSGQYVRFRNPDLIIEELKQLLETYPDTTMVFLETEAINIIMPYLEELSEKLSRFNDNLPHPIAFGANIRLNRQINIEKTIACFVKANIVVINIGLESGSERVRSEILKRSEYSNEDVLKAVKLAKKYHRHVMLFILLGIPGENKGEYEQTLEMARSCKPHFIHLGIFTPYPGTVLYNECVKNKWLDPAKYCEKGRNVATLNTPWLSKKQVQKQYHQFFPNVYAKNKKDYVIMRILCYLVLRRNWIFLSKWALKYLH